MDLQPVISILPPELRAGLARLELSAVEELRLRAGHPPAALLRGQERPIPGVSAPVTSRMLEQILSAATGHSCYSAEESLREGYVTLPGGHRIGLCGAAAVQDGRVRAIRSVSSLCVRIARQIPSAPPELVRRLRESALILGPPGCGKTTLLRDCVRQLSNSGQRVCIVDERGELAACHLGAAQLDVGAHTDVLTGCPKACGIPLLLRGMRPDWIAVDEITAPEDIRAMEQASYCGARFLATAHASGPDELQKRPLYRSLCTLGLFKTLWILTPDRQVREERMD